MSALGFFRKNQKLVFWIMVVLMFVFLISLSGIEPLLRLVEPGRGDVVIGRTGAAEPADVTWRQREAAQANLMVLTAMRLGDPLRVLAGPLLAGSPVERPGEKGFLLLTDEGGGLVSDPPLAWVLLTREARGMGFKSSRAMARDFLSNWLGWTDEHLAQQVEALRQIREFANLRTEDVHAAVEEYVLVSQAFQAAKGPLEPSEDELRKLYRDARELMEVATLSFRAEDYLDQAGQPTDEQVAALFAEARANVAGDPGNPHPFKFGYRMGDRVQVEYIFVNADDVLASIQPDEEAIYQYWWNHQEELSTRPATTAPGGATQPTGAAGPATAPTTETAPTTGPGTAPSTARYAEVKPEARRRWAQELASQRTSELAESALSRVNVMFGDANQADQAFAQVGQAMLAEGQPVVYRRTELLSAEDLLADPILSTAMRRPSGPMLAQTAFTVKQLTGQRRATGLTVGEPYPGVMDVVGGMMISGGRRGRLVWRVVQADPSKVLHEHLLAGEADLLAQVPESQRALRDRVREQVVRDWRLREAYRLAVAQARQAMDIAQHQGLAQAAQSAGKEIQNTPPLPRVAVGLSLQRDPTLQSVVLNALQALQWFQRGAEGEPPMMYGREVYVQAARVAPYFAESPNAPLNEAWYAEEAQKFLTAIFTLAPETPPATAPASQPTSAPAPADTLTLVELQAQRTAIVAQHVKFHPAYEEGYLRQRAELIRAMVEIRRHELARRWFSENDIIQRTKYQPRQTDREAEREHEEGHEHE